MRLYDPGLLSSRPNFGKVDSMSDKEEVDIGEPARHKLGLLNLRVLEGGANGCDKEDVLAAVCWIHAGMS
jgi:hypothetical protein